MNKKKFTVKDLAMIGVMAAIVFVGNQIQLPKIPTPLGPTRIHIGNVMCILGALLLGALPGGLAAGIGSLSYVALYLGKTFIVEYLVMGNPWQTVAGVLITKGTASLINAILAMVVSVILYYMMEPALKRTGILDTKHR